MAGGKTTQTSEHKIDPALMALYNQNYAREVGPGPFRPYSGEQVEQPKPKARQIVEAGE